MTGEGTLADRLFVIWTDMLGDTGTDVGFLSAGGHSLLAARLIARIYTELDATLSLATFIRDDPSLSELIALVERARHDTAPHPGQAPPAAHRTGSAPISPAMRRIWTWHRLHPDSPAYNVVRVLAVDGRVQPVALRTALADVVERHDALRCRVVEPAPARPEIVVGEPVPVPLTIEVVRDGSGPDLDAQVDAALRGLADRPIFMDAAPLWRCGLVWSPSTRRTWVTVVMHHIISDLRSSDIVLGDLATAYAARHTGCAPVWPGPAPELLRHLDQQAGITGSARWTADLDWWSERLAQHVHAVGSAQPAVADAEAVEHRANTVTVDVQAADTDAIDAMLRHAGITPAMLFLTAATAVLAARLGGATGVVGVPGVRMARPEDDGTVTFLLDTLLLAAGDPARSDRTILEACAATRLALVDAVDHATPAFDEILDRLRVPRTSRSPLVRLWFNDLTGATPPQRFGEHRAAEHDLPPGWALFDLGLYVWRTATGYRVHAVVPYGSAPLDDVAAFADQVVHVCRAAAADAGRRLVDLLPAAERAGETGDADTGPDHVLPTVELLARSAAEQPSAAALATADGVVDRRTLDAAVTALAAQVRTVAGAGSVVAVPARRDRLFIERLLACMRAGVVPVLFDATWPRRRRDGAAVLTRAGHAFPDGDGPLVSVSDSRGEPRDLAGGAHVLFTSGTTADPLPVLVPTAVTDAAVASLVSWLGVTSADRVALLSGPAHDPALRDIGLALRAGACLYLPPPAELRDVTGLAGWLRRERISVLSATPAMLALIFGADTGGGPGPVPDLRVVICGGSHLTSATAALIRSHAPRAVIVNGYGCVETPQLVVAHRLDPGDPLPRTPDVPIGRPLPGRQIELRTPDGRACADGEPGEMWVGEPWIASGYLTEGPTRFVDGSRRWLRTGDLARRDPTGLLRLVGRVDRQVLVNSYRVLLDEIEAAARGCPGVADALAELVGDERQQALRLWVQPASPAAHLAEADVRSHLTDVLATPAVPAKILIVDRLGLSENLKPTVPAAHRPVAHRAAGSVTPDARLTGTAAAILGGPVGATTNFFDAGFSSITLLQFGAELGTVLGRPVEPLWLFQHPNLQALAAALDLDTPPVAQEGTRPAPAVVAPPPPGTWPEPRRRRDDGHARMRDHRRQARAVTRESTDDAPG